MFTVIAARPNVLVMQAVDGEDEEEMFFLLANKQGDGIDLQQPQDYLALNC